MEKWRQYYQEQLGAKADKRNADKVEERDTDELTEDQEEESNGITKKEPELAIKKKKLGKSPRDDKITADIVKMGNEEKAMALELYNRLQKEEKIPDDWGIGQIVPIHTKGDNKQCNNYRGITLLSMHLKI